MENMLKHTLNIFLLVALSACGSDDSPNAREEFINQIVGSWTVDESSTIILDDEDITSLLVGFEITIDSELSYLSNSEELGAEVIPWPSAGSFVVSDDLTQFTRDDGLVITTNLDNNDKLNFTFQFSEEFDDSDGGRLQAIRGVWQFNLKRK
jgi:hypothetical protein